MREAVTVLAVSRTGRTRIHTRARARGNEPCSTGRRFVRRENIALFRNRANGYCGPFTGRQAAVSLYLIGCEEKTARGNWRTLHRRPVKYSSALRHLRSRLEMLDSIFSPFSSFPSSLFLLFFLLVWFWSKGIVAREWVNWLRCCLDWFCGKGKYCLRKP